MTKNARLTLYVGLFITQLIVGFLTAQAQTSTTREEFYIDLYPKRDNLQSRSQTAGEFQYIKASYKPSTKKFHLYVELIPHQGQPVNANGLEFVIANGGFPQSYAQVPMVYIDARNQSSPIVTVYSYGNGTDSWQKTFSPAANAYRSPDSIISSLNDPSFVDSVSVTNGTNGKKIFDIILNTAVIDSHIPRYPTNQWSWAGLKFAHKMSIKLYPVNITSAYYNTTSAPITYNGYTYKPGFLKKYERCGGYFKKEKIISVDCHGNPRIHCDYNCGQPINCQEVPGDTYDECGVCGGNDSTCTDCAGIPNGGTVVDECGVCGGTGTSCLDCAGVPNGGAQTDLCGVCVPAGQPMNQCLDCAGTPNGTAVVDQCGVCGGNNSTCSDCAGTPNGTAVVDACGVCNGDGTSCLCTTTTHGSSILALDGFSLKFQAVVTAGARGLVRYDKSSTTAKYVKATLAKARALHVNGWTIANTYPATTVACGTTATSCSITSLSTTIGDYNTVTSKFNSAAKDVAKRLTALSKRLSGKSKTAVKKIATKLSSDAASLVLQTTNVTKTLPTTTCR